MSKCKAYTDWSDKCAELKDVLEAVKSSYLTGYESGVKDAKVLMESKLEAMEEENKQWREAARDAVSRLHPFVNLDALIALKNYWGGDE